MSALLIFLFLHYRQNNNAHRNTNHQNKHPPRELAPVLLAAKQERYLADYLSLPVINLIGHRETMRDVYSQLEATIEQHITPFCVREFIVGNYGGFDRVEARALTAAKCDIRR